MPKKKETTEISTEGILVTAAKAIGTVAGKVAKLAGVESEPREPAVSQKVPKLSKKSKGKLPRREKKAAKKSSQ